MLQLDHASPPARPRAESGASGRARRPAGPHAEQAAAAPSYNALLRRAAREFAGTPAPILAASFLANLLALALPLTLLQIYDRVLPNAALNTLVALLAGLMGAVVLDVALRILRDSLITHVATEKAFRGRVLGFATLLHADPARVREKSARFWLDRMTAVEEVASVKENADKSLFIDLPFVAIFLGMTALIGGWLVLVPLALIAVVTVVMLWMSRCQRALMEERREQDEKRYAQITEWLGGIATIKLLAMETQIYRRFEAMLARGVAYSYHAVLQNNRTPMLGQLFSNLMMVGVSTGGAMRVIEGSMSIGSLACCSLLATRVAQPVFRVVSIAAHMQSAALLEARARTIYSLPIMVPATDSEPLQGDIQFAEVSVAPRPGWTGFRPLSLHIPPSAIIGIVGPTGSGKSALLSLVDGTLVPDTGNVLIDGSEASSAEIRRHRSAIQRIDGRVAIFRGTILENVAMFRTGVYIAEAVAAIEAIGLDAQINKLPEGYDTRIGDGAQMVLPYGFQQALMIARALAQRPAILLVAQIGALLDVDNFRRLERALRYMPERPTTILASQRAGVFAVADHVYEIRGGTLASLGDVMAATPQPMPAVIPGYRKA
jgi:ATP-binding cassette subfamily C protein LapB